MFSRGSERGRGRGRGNALPNLGRGRGGGDLAFSSRGGRGGRGGIGPSGRGSVGVQVFSHSPSDAPALNLQVQKAEDDIERASHGNVAPGPEISGDGQRMPQRPGFGTQGKKVLLWANYFTMDAPKDLLLFRYSIELLPGTAGRQPVGKKLKRIVELLLEEHFSAHRNLIATDFKSTLICKTVLPLSEELYSVTYRTEGGIEPARNATTYQIRLQSTGTVSVSQLIEYPNSTQARAVLDSKDETIQALNIAVGHHPKIASHIFSVGANKHFELHPAESETCDLGAGLQAIRGFFFSVRAATSRILVNIQVKHAACYSEGPLTRSISCFNEANHHDVNKLEKFLKKVRISVTHIKKKDRYGNVIVRIKTISSLAQPGDGQGLEHPPIVPRRGAGAKEVKFFLGRPGEQVREREQPSAGTHGRKGKQHSKSGPQKPEEGYISVYDFFRRTYNITVGNPALPVVNVGTRENPSYLPAEVCVVLPGQPSGAKLSPSQTRLMIRHAVRKPAQNAQSIVVEGLRIAGIQPATDILGTFGLTVMPRLITVPGRVLPGPQVKYKDGKIANTSFGGWNMQVNKFSATVALPYWTYLVFSVNGWPDAWNNREGLASTLSGFVAKLKELGINAANCTPGPRIELPNRDGRAPNQDVEAINQAVEAQIDKAIQQIVGRRPLPGLLLVIMPKEDSLIYNRVKYMCDIKEGLRNVCVIGSKLAGGNPQYFANVALKINLKLGGRNQFLDNPKLGMISNGKTMVVGLDVTHPSPGSAIGAPSIAGMVASVDRFLGQWPAELRIQKARQEMVSGIDDLLKSRLQLWAKHNNNSYPENILVYRDGVSEGQYEIILDQELQLLRKGCREMYPANDTKKGIPRISIIIVGKRHNTRFYPIRPEDADRSSNPQNGTVVDRGVTEACNWDFFLQAHTALQGTARPAHYYVIYDEIFRDHHKRQQAPSSKHAADILEDLTHNMCYLYGRATKAVSICPPAYYADLVCERARRYMSKLFDSTPETTPAGSAIEGIEGGVQGLNLNDLSIHPNVRDTMFYI